MLTKFLIKTTNFLYIQLRHHPLPREQHFEHLIQCAQAKGFTVNTSSNKALADSLDKCVDSTDPHVNKVSGETTLLDRSLSILFSHLRN